MILERIYDEKLSQAGYLIACERSRLGIVIDAGRDISAYTAAAARFGARIAAVTETHIHADFVSGSLALARRTGAQLYLSDSGGPDWKYAFAREAGAELITDGSQFMIGDVRIEAVHTPGHTPEHMSFLVTDTATASAPIGAITGDFIFAGDVGRPDLLERAAGAAGTMQNSARQLFQSLQAFKQLPAWLQLWPGHGAGSACGKSLASTPQTTLGYEMLFNWALAEPNEARFVEEVLAGQPEPPAYFAVMKRVNRDGPPIDAPVVPREAEAEEIARALRDGATVIDTRPVAEFAREHVRGSINIPRNKSFLHWSGALVPYDRELWILDSATELSRRQLASDLSLIGLDRISGVFPSGSLAALAAAGIGMSALPQVSTNDVASRSSALVLDVRSAAEFAHGHLPRAINIPLTELARRIDEVPKGEIIVHCQGGTRSAIASSVLERNGMNGVSNMSGGITEWEREGHPVQRERNEARS